MLESFAPGMLAGPYRLERELGRGGMEVVWLAARADVGPKRDVALKFPLLCLDSQTLANRFARERDQHAPWQPTLLMHSTQVHESLGSCPARATPAVCVSIRTARYPPPPTR